MSARNPAVLRPGDRFVWPETDFVATVERVTPCAAYVRLAQGARHVEIRSAAGDVVREFDAAKSTLLAITPTPCVRRLAR
jgi:hypothetical protein